MTDEPAMGKPLRFCMITTFYPPYNFGGDGIFVQRLANSLARRGHHVTVIHCTDAYSMTGAPEPTGSVSHHPNIEVHALRSGAGILSPLVTHQLGTPGIKRQAIKRILENNSFDVIHFHNISLVGGPGILAYGNAVKLYTAHEYWLVCPLSTLWTYQREPCETKNCISCTLHARRPPQWWRYTKLLEQNLAHLDVLISPSRFLIQKHREMGLAADFTHIPNFLPIAEERHTEVDDVQAPEPNRPFFLMVGRLEKSKGFQRAIAVFQDFTGADLIIVGSGLYEPELRSLASAYDHIRLMGQMSYAALIQLYRRAVAVIVPSIWFEPFGLIVIEAYAQRTPVIVNNAGALPELVADSGGGIVYHDNAGLRDAVETLLQAPAQRNELGEKGYNAYRQQWTEESYLQQYFSVINQIITQKQQAAPAN